MTNALAYFVARSTTTEKVFELRLLLFSRIFNSVADNIVGVCRVIYAEKFSYPLVNIINFFFFVFENTLLITPGEHFQLKIVIRSTHGKRLCCPLVRVGSETHPLVLN